MTERDRGERPSEEKKEQNSYYERITKFTNKSSSLKNNYYNLKQGSGYTSPPSSKPAYELKMFQQYMHGVNLQKLGESLPQQKKEMNLIKFFKHKRNQQVEVNAIVQGEKLHTIGKVNVVGRDFVGLTTLRVRLWFPYTSIESANVPYGIPDIPNSHQHLVYDEDLRRKLLTEFSKTVAGREQLKRQFYEEALQTHLQTWKGTRVIVFTKEGTKKGRIAGVQSGLLSLKSFKEQYNISMKEIQLVKTVSPFQTMTNLFKWLKQTLIRLRR